MGSPGRTPSSRLSSLPRVRTGLWPVSLARTFSAFCSFSPPSPTPMLTVTLAMRGCSMGLPSPAAAGALGVCFTMGLAGAAGLAGAGLAPAGLPCGDCLGASPLGAAGFDCCVASTKDLRLRLGQVGRVADGEGVRLDGGERLLADGEVDEVRLVAARDLDRLD